MSAAAAWRARCTDTVEGLRGPLLKRTKRTIQDEQNALLDAVRRHRGRPAAETVLPEAEAAVDAWVAVLAEAVGSAYAGGIAAAGGRAAPVDDAVSHRSGARFGPRAIRSAQYTTGSLTLRLRVLPQPSGIAPQNPLGQTAGVQTHWLLTH